MGCNNIKRYGFKNYFRNVLLHFLGGLKLPYIYIYIYIKQRAETRTVRL